MLQRCFENVHLEVCPRSQFRALLEQAIAETIESLELGDADACCQVSDQVAVRSVEAITVRRSAHGERAPLQIPFRSRDYSKSRPFGAIWHWGNER